jgi:hypothetical protein
MSDPEGQSEFRRQQMRVRLAADGAFLGLDGRQTITVLDLSQIGARVAFQEPPWEKAGFLSWMEFETFGDVMWREGLYVGLKFDRPIPFEWLVKTSERVTDADAYRREVLLNQAKAWVEGSTQSSTG